MRLLLLLAIAAQFRDDTGHDIGPKGECMGKIINPSAMVDRNVADEIRRQTALLDEKYAGLSNLGAPYPYTIDAAATAATSASPIANVLRFIRWKNLLAPIDVSGITIAHSTVGGERLGTAMYEYQSSGSTRRFTKIAGTQNWTTLPATVSMTVRAITFPTPIAMDPRKVYVLGWVSDNATAGFAGINMINADNQIVLGAVAAVTGGADLPGAVNVPGDTQVLTGANNILLLYARANPVRLVDVFY